MEWHDDRLYSVTTSILLGDGHLGLQALIALSSRLVACCMRDVGQYQSTVDGNIRGMLFGLGVGSDKGSAPLTLRLVR